jgi:hypothetical protein
MASHPILTYSKDKTLSAKYNVDEFPTLMFFENQIPSKHCQERKVFPDPIKVCLTVSWRSLKTSSPGWTTY